MTSQRSQESVAYEPTFLCNIWNRKETQEIKKQIKNKNKTDSKYGEDSERVMYDKMKNKMEWKSYYLGIGLIGGMWCSSFHCLYALATVELSAYGLTTLDFGILYGLAFFGLVFSILWFTRRTESSENASIRESITLQSGKRPSIEFSDAPSKEKDIDRDRVAATDDAFGLFCFVLFGFVFCFRFCLLNFVCH